MVGHRVTPTRHDRRTDESKQPASYSSRTVCMYSGTTDVVDLVRLTSPTKTAIIEMRM